VPSRAPFPELVYLTVGPGQIFFFTRQDAFGQVNTPQLTPPHLTPYPSSVLAHSAQLSARDEDTRLTADAAAENGASLDTDGPWPTLASRRQRGDTEDGSPPRLTALRHGRRITTTPREPHHPTGPPGATVG
jgi:hypothetical protein